MCVHSAWRDMWHLYLLPAWAQLLFGCRAGVGAQGFQDTGSCSQRPQRRGGVGGPGVGQGSAGLRGQRGGASALPEGVDGGGTVSRWLPPELSPNPGTGPRPPRPPGWWCCHRGTSSPSSLQTGPRLPSAPAMASGCARAACWCRPTRTAWTGESALVRSARPAPTPSPHLAPRGPHAQPALGRGPVGGGGQGAGRWHPLLQCLEPSGQTRAGAQCR